MDDKIMGPKPDEPDQADELADLLGGLGVAGGRKCEVCFIKRVYPAACSIATDACSRLDDQNAQHCKDCKDLAHKARARSSDSDGGLPPSSAKIRMLIKLLKDVEDRSRQTEKTIVFSQFTSFLNLIEPFLKSAGLAYVRCESPSNSRPEFKASIVPEHSVDDGSMRNDKRQDALEKIKTSTTVRVILISFKCGSTGKHVVLQTSCAVRTCRFQVSI